MMRPWTQSVGKDKINHWPGEDGFVGTGVNLTGFSYFKLWRFQDMEVLIKQELLLLFLFPIKSNIIHVCLTEYKSYVVGYWVNIYFPLQRGRFVWVAGFHMCHWCGRRYWFSPIFQVPLKYLDDLADGNAQSPFGVTTCISLQLNQGQDAHKINKKLQVGIGKTSPLFINDHAFLRN